MRKLLLMFSGREDERNVISPLAHKPMFASYAPLRSEGLHVMMSETPSSICPTIETEENFSKKPSSATSLIQILIACHINTPFCFLSWGRGVSLTSGVRFRG